MTADRLDDLLERTLAGGAIPPDASDDERRALEPLLAARAELLAARSAVDTEAAESMPAARARFQRYLAAQRPVPVETRVVTARSSLLQRLIGGRRLSLAGSLAALLLVAAIALFATRPFQGAQEVQALGVDDYVQVAGTVSSASDTTLQLQSPDLGAVTVDASASTVVDAQGNVVGRLPRPGEQVIVSGTVRDARAGRVAIAGQALALGAAIDIGSPSRFERIDSLPAAREGTLTLIAIDRDGRKGRAIVLLADGRRALVDVDPVSLGQVVAESGVPLGKRVRLGDGDGPGFNLERVDGDEGPGHPEGEGRGHGFIRLTGTVTRVAPDHLTLQVGDTTVTVRRPPGVRVLPGESGLSLADLRNGASFEGYTATVAAAIDPRDGTAIAALVVLGPRP
ncbi:MAG: hypothetical protein KatS3mg062_0965 [Tepidiforma sp.]|nr:MAG: hypothetical protein KatS3mg062_0965 [Tepidiforma sp.]